jgi:hypothetical protein
MKHTRLTKKEVFIRYVGANHASDYDRLDDWAEKLTDWFIKGLKNIHFFVHQNLELDSPLLYVKFIEKLNKKLGSNLQIPKTLHDSSPTLFYRFFLR